MCRSNRWSAKLRVWASGVIVDAARGLVLTNNHVVANATQVTVTLRDGRHLDAEVVGADPATDVAVIKVPAENLVDLNLANSDSLRVGDFVVAIGNPFGLGQTVTSGIVSALSRSGLGIEGYEDFIQTDASINPGQLRRRPGQPGRRTGGHQHGDIFPHRRQHRHRFRHSH